MAIDRSAADKFIKYILKSADVFIFLIKTMTADIFVTKAIKVVPPYSRTKTFGKGSGSAIKSDNSAVLLVSNVLL